ncbi:MAG: uracil-DNA glycosylase family protein [Chthoniobacterales bacterium]
MSDLQELVESIRACTLCPKMIRPGVSGGAVFSKVISVGQAPGTKEPLAGKPFAWTAGKTLFKWFSESCGVDEEEFRRTVYMAAVCRCFPGKTKQGGDRVPDPLEIATCRRWLEGEFAILKPKLILPIGKLAIRQFLPESPLSETIGKSFRVDLPSGKVDVIPLPHPSGASPWHRMEPGKTLLQEALALIAKHPAWKNRV